MLHWWQDPLSREIERAVVESIKRHGPVVLRQDRGPVLSVVKRVYGVFKRYERGDFDQVRARTREKVGR